MREGKGRNRTGSLYRRWKGKKCRVNDADAKEGKIYLKYTVGGKTIETSLGTSNIDVAKKKQQEIMKPLELANQSEVLEQTELRLKRVHNEQDREWKKKNPPLKLDDAWEAYLKSKNRPTSGPRTLDGYTTQYKLFRGWLKSAFPEAVYMKDVGTREAEAYAEYLGSRKLSPATYNQILNALALTWSVLFEKAQVQENPFGWDRKTRKGINRRSLAGEVSKRRRRPLSVEEIDEILKHAEGDYRTLIMILVCTGQRLVDGVKLEWSSINFDRHVISLTPQKTARRTGKTVHIPLFPQLEVELLKREKTGRYVLPELVKDYNRYNPSVSKNLKSIFVKAGIQTSKKTDFEIYRAVTDVGAHSLRHTFVTIARMARIPDPIICQITGHSSQQMVDHYTHFSEEMVATLAGKFLGETAGKTTKALPAPFSESVKEPMPAWAKTKTKDIVKMIGKIKGKPNAKVKAAILEALGELA